MGRLVKYEFFKAADSEGFIDKIAIRGVCRRISVDVIVVQIFFDIGYENAL